jgi:hypothetical protein
MLIYALDPGLTSGIARVDTKNMQGLALQTTDPRKAYDQINEWAYSDYANNRLYSLKSSMFVGELFTGGGYLTKEAKKTVKIIGYFEYSIEDDYGWPQTWVPADMRKSALEEAKTYEVPGPHGIDALAHAIAHARRIGEWD